MSSRAFDTLAKVLHAGDDSSLPNLEATMRLMSGDQSGPVLDVEGSLLSESHIPFKVSVEGRGGVTYVYRWLAHLFFFFLYVRSL